MSGRYLDTILYFRLQKIKIHAASKIFATKLPALILANYGLDFYFFCGIFLNLHGGVAQVVRAYGSYP